LNAIDLLKKGSRKLTDYVELGRSFFSDSFEYDDAAIAKYLGKSSEESEILGSALEQLRLGYETLESFDLERTEAILREIVAERGLKAGKFIGSVRVAMTGKAHAPGIFEVLVLLGRDRVLARLDRVVAYLASKG
jgi:glutamyl-tRNA synthetase